MVMQVFDNNSVDIDKWHVGDTIRYGTEHDDESSYAKVVAFTNAGRIYYSTMLISKDKFLDGQLSVDGRLNLGNDDYVKDIDELKKKYFFNWDYVDIVPMYGVVGKPNGDPYIFPTNSDFAITIESVNNGFRGLTPEQQQKSIKEFEGMLKGLKAIAKHDN